MDEEDISFGQWLQRRRQALHLTQQQLGNLAGCSVGMIRKIEADERRPSADVARLLATALQLPTREHQTFLRYARGERAEAPAVPAEATPRTRPMQPSTNLPAPTTALIGRTKEVVAVQALLERHDVRLVTLTGPGGIGKTRLSVAVGEALRDAFVDGVFFVDLAPLSDPDLVLSTIAQTIEVKETSGTALLATVQSYLGDKQLLIILDNFEQVLAAGLVVAALLRAAPHLKVLVTSRAALHLQGEHEYAVLPLAAPLGVEQPTLATVSQYDAVKLFIERAQAVKPNFDITSATAGVVAEICYRLDGLPLAIELAAARIKLLTPHALLQRLSSRLALLTHGPRDLLPRQQALRNTIDWSYNLLDEVEQQLFAQFAVFVSGCTLDAVEQVCVFEHGSSTDVFSVLASLVDKSLLRQEEQWDGDSRFKMLETIREYAWERFVISGSTEAIQKRHAIYYMHLLEQPEQGAPPTVDEASVKRVRADYDNIRAALEWALSAGHPGIAAQIASTIDVYWYAWGQFNEGRRWVEATLAHAASLSPRIRAKLLWTLGSLATLQADHKYAMVQLEASLQLARQLGDTQLIAWALNDLALIFSSQEDYAQAAALFDESLVYKRMLGSISDVAITLNNMGALAMEQHEYHRAQMYLEESLTLFHTTGDNAVYVGATMRNLGELELLQGNSMDAARHFSEGLVRLQKVDYIELIADCLRGLAAVACSLGQTNRGTRLFGIAERLRKEIGASLLPSTRTLYEEYINAARGQLGSEYFSAIWNEGQLMSIETAISYALTTSEQTEEPPKTIS